MNKTIICRSFYSLKNRGVFQQSEGHFPNIQDGGVDKPQAASRSRYRHSAVVHGCAMFVFGGVDKRQARRWIGRSLEGYGMAHSG